MKTPKNTISNWLEEHGDPEIEQFVEKNMAISYQVHCILEEKGWSKSDFAQKLGKRPSEITKWLSGTHNLTLKSIIKMENVLGVSLIQIPNISTQITTQASPAQPPFLHNKHTSFK